MMAALCVGWFGLYGSPPAGRLHFDGQRVLDACLILHVHGNCFHQIAMIASIKFSFLFAARIAPEPWYLCMFFLFFK